MMLRFGKNAIQNYLFCLIWKSYLCRIRIRILSFWVTRTRIRKKMDRIRNTAFHKTGVNTLYTIYWSDDSTFIKVHSTALWKNRIFVRNLQNHVHPAGERGCLPLFPMLKGGGDRRGVQGFVAFIQQSSSLYLYILQYFIVTDWIKRYFYIIYIIVYYDLAGAYIIPSSSFFPSYLTFDWFFFIFFFQNYPSFDHSPVCSFYPHLFPFFSSLKHSH